VSTRRIEGLVRTLGIERISKSRVSQMAKELDGAVEAFRNRPLDGGPYTYVWLDALTQKVREGGRIANVACVIGTAVNASGNREILGLDLHTSEDGAGWTAFLRGLVARGLTGVRLVISDAHPGLVDAIASTLPGASWQRCRTHFLRNLLTKVPKSAGPFVATLVRSIFAQPDAAAVHAQFDRATEQLSELFPAAAQMLGEAGPDILAFTLFPQPHWRQIWSTNPQERLNKEIRRRTDVVGIFPDRGSVIRLVGMVLCEQHDEWAVVRRYMSPESLAKARLEVIEGEAAEEVRGELVAAS
jgi:transposase-like protein